FDQTQQVCDEGRRKFPKESTFWNMLAWFYATSKNPQFKNPARALEYARKAIALDEIDGPGPFGARSEEYLETLAEAYFANKKYEQAIETQKLVVRSSPDNTSFKRNLERFELAAKDRR